MQRDRSRSVPTGKPKRRARLWKAVVAVMAVTFFGCGANENPSADLATGSATSEHTSTSSQPTPATDEGEAIQAALEFFEARNAWDGHGVRKLIADDADVTDFAVDEPDDYLAMAVLERTMRWQYLDLECTATPSGEVAQVGCTYVVQNRLAKATGTGPYRGSRIDFEVRDGLIQMVTNAFDHSLYGDEVLVPFTEWINANHPGDRKVMWFIDDFGEVNRSLTPESLALWAKRLPEYAAFKDAN